MRSTYRDRRSPLGGRRALHPEPHRRHERDAEADATTLGEAQRYPQHAGRRHRSRRRPPTSRRIRRLAQRRIKRGAPAARRRRRSGSAGSAPAVGASRAALDALVLSQDQKLSGSRSTSVSSRSSSGARPRRSASGCTAAARSRRHGRAGASGQRRVAGFALYREGAGAIVIAWRLVSGQALNGVRSDRGRRRSSLRNASTWHRAPRAFRSTRASRWRAVSTAP